MNAPDDTLIKELKDERIALFSVFNEDDLAYICQGLYQVQDAYHGAMRVYEYQKGVVRKDNEVRRRYKHAYILWRTARATYQQKYGHMPS